MPRIRSLLGGARVEKGGVRFRWQRGKVTVEFPATQRSQVVHYSDSNGDVELVSTVARRAVVLSAGLEAMAHEMLQRNRLTGLVAFRFGKDDRIEGWVRLLGTLHRDDLIHGLSALARECDRFEGVLIDGNRQ